jgi:hypothetical protein
LIIDPSKYPRISQENNFKDLLSERAPDEELPEDLPLRRRNPIAGCAT